MASTKAIWTLRLQIHFFILIFENAFLGSHLRKVVFEAKVVYLATFLIKLVLSKEYNAVICSPAFVLNLHWMHYALWIYDEVNHTRLPRYFEL
jgi:hypothetical protein